MANRRIKLESTLNDKNDLVYVDLDLNAIPATALHLTPVDEEISTLKLDFTNNSRNDLQTWSIYTTQDATSTRTELEIVFGFFQPINPYIDKYNEEQNRRSKLKLSTNINVRAVLRSIHNIFSWTPGERILNPEFGSKLRQYLYEGITPYNTELIMAEIRHCFEEWEPRAHLELVINRTNNEDVENNTVRIDIIYSIPSLTKEQYAYTIEVEKPV